MMRSLRSYLDRAVPVAVLVTGIVAAVLIGAVVSGEVEHVRRETVANTEQRLLGATEALAEHVDSTVSSIDVASLYLRDVWQNNRPHFAAIAAEIRKAAIPGLNLQVSVIDRDGWLAFSTLPSEGKINFADREHFQVQVAADDDVIFISKPVVGRLSKQTMIQVSRRLVDKAGYFDGIVVVAIRPDDLIRIYDNLDLGAEGTVGLIGTDRVVRVRQSHVVEETRELSNVLPADRVYFRPDAAPAGVFHTASGGVDQRPRIIAYRRMTSYPLIVYASETDLDITTRTSPHDRELALVGRLGEAGVLTFAAVVAWFFRRLFRNQAKLAATNRVRLAAELQLHDTIGTLSRANADLGRFAHIASHDLQEPSRTLVSFSQLLERHLGDRLDATEREFLGFIISGARRMSELVQDLGYYTRITGRQAAHLAVNLETVVVNARDSLRAMIEERDARLEIGPLPTVTGDSTLLFELFRNLIGNAIKFTPADRPPRIGITARRDGDWWFVAVSDQGVGIAPEYHQRIFEIFQRLHAGSAYPGTGIGLTVCKGIVEQHGGRIWVESEVGHGAIFHFTLRAVPSAE